MLKEQNVGLKTIAETLNYYSNMGGNGMWSENGEGGEGGGG